MSSRKFVYGYSAIMVGGLVSLTAHSPATGFLVGGATAALSFLHGALVPSGPSSEMTELLAGDDFRRRWRSLSTDGDRT
jgi:hypothetical protein